MTEDRFARNANNWTFSEIGIAQGEELEWVFEPTKIITVRGDREVDCDGVPFPDLPALAEEFGHWDENDPPATRQFKYGGETIYKLRIIAEKRKS